MPACLVAHVWERGPREGALRYVLLALADVAAPTGRVGLEFHELRRRTALEEEALQTALDRLAEDGWIERKGRIWLNRSKLAGAEPRSGESPLRGVGGDSAPPQKEEGRPSGDPEKLRRIAQGQVPAPTVKGYYDHGHWACLMHEAYFDADLGIWPKDRIRQTVSDPSRWAEALLHAKDQGWKGSSVGHMLTWYEEEAESAYPDNTRSSRISNLDQR